MFQPDLTCVASLIHYHSYDDGTIIRKLHSNARLLKLALCSLTTLHRFDFFLQRFDITFLLTELRFFFGLL